MATSNQTIPAGGVTINTGNPPPQNQIPVNPLPQVLQPQPFSPPPADPVQETVVIPSNIPPVPTAQPNPAFMPNSGNTAETFNIPVSGSAPATKGGGMGGVVKVLLIVVILAILGGAGYFAYSHFSAAKQITLTYWGLWENDDIIKPAITDFEAKNPNIKIQYVKQSQQQYRERVAAAVDRGDGPDIFRFHNTWVPMLKNELAIVPKDVMTVDEFTSTFFPVAKNDLIGGNTAIYGLPLEFDGLGLYVNEDLFAAAGASPPTTWEDVTKPGGLVDKLTVKANNTITTSAIALGTTNNVENFSDIIATMIMQNGGSLVDPSGAEAQSALTFYRKFADPNESVYTWNASFDNSVYAFATGRVAMILAPSWRAFDIKQITPTANFKIVPIPQLVGNTVNWASYWVEGVSSKSKNQPAAWDFVKFLTSKDEATKIYTEAAKTRLFGEPYARKDMVQTVSGDPYVDAYIQEAPTAKSFPLASRTFDNGMNDKMIKYVEDAVNSMATGNSPQQALSTVSDGFKQVLNQYGLTVSSAPAGQ